MEQQSRVNNIRKEPRPIYVGRIRAAQNAGSKSSVTSPQALETHPQTHDMCSRSGKTDRRGGVQETQTTATDGFQLLKQQQ